MNLIYDECFQKAPDIIRKNISEIETLVQRISNKVTKCNTDYEFPYDELIIDLNVEV